MRRRLACALLLALLPASAARAHKPSDGYLALARDDGGGLRGRLELSLRDLEQALGLDADGDGRITWGELRARARALDTYALAHLALAADGARCPTRAAALELDHHSDGTYAVLHLLAECPAGARSLEVDYGVFFDIDPQHRGLLRLEDTGATHTAIFSPDRRKQTLALGAPAPGRDLLAYTHLGVEHVAAGFDHLLFLVSLLLPAALRREGRCYRPAPSLRPMLGEVLRIVTGFTVAHSLSLGLAAAGLLALPSRAVESAIAASVIVAAANNVIPLWHGRSWLVAFGFGLIHGFGFASVLGDLGLEGGPFVARLVGFNLGVELGQLAVVAVLLPLLYPVRSFRWYRAVALPGLSAAIAALALVWLAERSLDIALL